MKIEKREHTAEGFARIYESDRFTVALKNAGPSNSREAVRCLERHNETDEIFILLVGEASVLEGDVEEGRVTALRESAMERGKLYVIPCGVWHNTWMSGGAAFAIIENVETSYDNTDVVTFAELEREEVRL